MIARIKNKLNGASTSSRSLISAVVIRLLEYGLCRYLGESAGFIHGAIYVAIVLLLSYGIVETEGGTLISVVSSMLAVTENKVTIEAYGEKGRVMYADRPFPHVKFMGVKVRKERPLKWGVHALQRSLSGLAKWILDDKPFLIPAASTIQVLKAVDAIYRSAGSGNRVELKPK